jgi:hypothetical protein
MWDAEMIMKGERVRIWQEIAVACLKLLLWYFHEILGKTTRNLNHDG